MDVVNSKEEIEHNLSLFEDYLCRSSPNKQKFAFSLVQKGRCFIAYEIAGELRFAPSRYVGYANNSMSKHNRNPDKHGSKTNTAINKVFGNGRKLEPNIDLEAKYLSFCERLGIEPHNRRDQRQYWRFNIEGGDFKNNSSSDEGFPEGKIVERLHKARERNIQLISKAKDNFLQEKGKLYCVVCHFDFEAVYGERGRGYIEAHHTVPVSKMKVGDRTKLDDIALVCSNCHKILHRTRPWLTMDKLKELLKNEI